MAGQNISILAFADDIILISRDTATAQKQLMTLHSFLTEMGMELSTGKCSTFLIKTSHKTWDQMDPRLQVGHELVPYASGVVIRYIGVTIRAWTGCST